MRTPTGIHRQWERLAERRWGFGKGKVEREKCITKGIVQHQSVPRLLEHTRKIRLPKCTTPITDQQVRLELAPNRGLDS